MFILSKTMKEVDIEGDNYINMQISGTFEGIFLQKWSFV